MTEQEWLACDDPQKMLEFLRGKVSGGRLHPGMSSKERKMRLRKLSDRKLRMFAIVCCRRITNLFVSEHYERAIEVAERLAEGLATKAERRRASFAPSGGIVTFPRFACSSALQRSAFHAATRAASNAACAVAMAGIAASGEDSHSPAWRQHYHKEGSTQQFFLRCIFDNPFRPVTIDTAWLTPTVLSLAQAAYDNRILPSGTLESARLVVLADALETAGCDNVDILTHLRHPGEHVRGCWVLDLVLGLS